MGRSADRLARALLLALCVSACSPETPAAGPPTTRVTVTAGSAGIEVGEAPDAAEVASPTTLAPSLPEGVDGGNPIAAPAAATPRVDVLGAVVCADPTGDVWAASGAPVSTPPPWADVTELRVELGPATSLVRWELAEPIGDPAYGESDAFAWSTWTVVFEGDRGRLHVTARVDRDVWWAVHHLADAAAPEVEAAVYPSGRTIEVVFDSDELATIGDDLRWFGLAEIGPPGQRVDPVFDRWNDVVCGDDLDSPFSALRAR